MELETVVYPQDPFYYACKEFYYLDGALSQDEDKDFTGISKKNIERGLNGNLESSSNSAVQNVKDWDPNSSPEGFTMDQFIGERSPTIKAAATISSRHKRRRTRSSKNKEELENLRMTHIAIERNRRKQMNEYLVVIRSLMPTSYVQRGDQASIIGGAIDFVKELEQQLQTLEAQKRIKQESNNDLSPIFSDFFAFPQYSARSTQGGISSGIVNDQPIAENRSVLADIEVTMVESHANIKILSKRRPRQLLKIVAGLQCLRLTILHLNVTKFDQIIFYTLSVKLEDGCRLTTVDEIANAVNHLLGRIQQEAVFC